MMILLFEFYLLLEGVSLLVVLLLLSLCSLFVNLIFPYVNIQKIKPISYYKYAKLIVKGISNSIFFGMLASLSSTAIVLKLLSDKNEIDAPHGRTSLVILILQDLAIVLMLIFLPVLSGGNELTAKDIIIQLIYAFGLIAVIVLLARVLMPKILFQLARLRIREAFTIGVIFLLLGTAYLTYSIGLSFAIIASL